MQRRFWHLACVNPKTGNVTSLSETDADHLEAFWEANAGNPIKQEVQTPNVKPKWEGKGSPDGKPDKLAMKALRKRDALAKARRKRYPNSPNTPTLVRDSNAGGKNNDAMQLNSPPQQVYRFGEDTTYASVPLQQDYRFGKDTTYASVPPPPPLFLGLNDEGDNDTGPNAPPPQGPPTVNRPPLGLKDEGNNGTESIVPPPPHNGTGPAPAPDVPRILYVAEYAEEKDKILAYDAIMLHKASKWWFVVPRKGGLYENKVCKKHSGLPLLSLEWWRLAFCGYETEGERTKRTSLRDICL
jgi:hypothetical protein